MTSTVTLASLALTGYAAYYLIACVLFPFGRCHRCHGTGHRHTITGRRRECRRCHATGRRIRIGRRLYEHIRTEYRSSR